MSTKQSSSSKRKREVEDSSSDGADEEAAASVTSFRGWLDEGSPGPGGRIEHESFTLSIADEEVEISLGDAVLLRNSGEDSSVDVEESFDYYGSSNKTEDRTVIARVERIIEKSASDMDTESQGGQPIFLARWFLKKEEVESLRGCFSGVTSADDFISRLSNKDLVLGNQTDEAPLSSICGAVQVVYRRPDADQELPEMPSDTYVCRYTTRIGEEPGHVDVIPYNGANDKWSDYLYPEESRDHTAQIPVESVSSGSLSSSDSESQHERSPRSGLDEGSTEKRDIRVGPKHQAIVPQFAPNQASVSRKPTPVWKPGVISSEKLDIFLSRAAAILVPYLQSNKLTHDEPYSPLQWERLEELYHSLGSSVMPTLSTVCTASSLSGHRFDMLRECDSDAILAVLHEKNYDIEASLAAIEANPRDFLTVWSVQEKELFNSGFRRYSGSLRMIYKGITPSKDFKDVIDYHYRFKIPDQFRCFQDKKREQAVRMMECIETRRNISAGIQNSSFGNTGGEPNTKKRIVESEWPKTGISDIAGAVEERRIKAKKLLLDVETEMGKDKLVEIVDVIKRLNERSITTNLRALVVDICTGHPEFEKRLLEFLPKRFTGYN